jgi:hypothetical protein
MSSDLLGVVRGTASEGGGGGRGGRRGGLKALPPPDLELGEVEEDAAPAPAEGGAMGAFFAEVATIKGYLETIRRSLHKLEAANDESKTATKASRIADIRERMEQEVSEVGKTARDAKQRLELLEKANEEARQKKGCGAGSSQDRTRTSITLSLHKKLRDLMAAFTELRGKFAAEYKEVVERRYFAIYGKKARAPLLRCAPPRALPCRRAAAAGACAGAVGRLGARMCGQCADVRPVRACVRVRPCVCAGRRGGD